MSEIKFGELPPAGGDRRRQHAAIAEQLKERSGEWALIGAFGTASTACSMAHAIQRGLMAAYRPAGAFKAKARTIEGEHRVYARHVGHE